MTVADNEELYPVAALGRDLPLTFQYRTELSVIAELGLPDARSSREEDARNAVLTEAMLAYERKKWVSFSRRPASYTKRQRYCGDSFRHGPVLSAIANGADAGLLEEDRVRPGSRGRQSRFRATTALYERLKEHPIRRCLHEPIWLRDDDRRLLNYRDTALTRRMRKEVEAINAEMAHITVELPGVEKNESYWLAADGQILPGISIVRRVFNRGSFKKGGRLYGWWQGLRAAERAQLLLDGKQVLEPDYRQLHAAIIYAQRETRSPVMPTKLQNFRAHSASSPSILRSTQGPTVARSWPSPRSWKSIVRLLQNCSVQLAPSTRLLAMSSTQMLV